ncbi:hypothetical protein [Streptomyces anulatus]|uniref:Uncharacterized protein n=1 Tax=Streptomyces anulatus TaxID=1892 RepID=A0A7K3RE97_STRAQ|nr:hypothetical protein [Streptomyces anulatus]NEC00534.1 hypothetical protein [Streptomyces anulatus]NED29862.1 hypothetical protein [Streptomyces anulatus]
MAFATVTIAAVTSVLLSPTAASAVVPDRSELVSKEGGVLYKFHNSGLNPNGTVNWGAKTAIGQGWGAVSNDAVYFAEIS